MAKKPPTSPDPPPDEHADLMQATGGLSPEAFVEHVYSGVQEALGEADVLVVAHVLDRSVGELLDVAVEWQGAQFARDMALKFGATLLPYIETPEPKVVSYRDLRIRGRKTE